MSNRESTAKAIDELAKLLKVERNELIKFVVMRNYPKLRDVVRDAVTPPARR